eukprot:GGOE01022671.1.p1 GENE.GGOE01022671.1~~GGOE01022671.1.p1  ORF type:complete len:662 (-),score=126.70 GGOE01022671.1:225-2162(-)
MVDTCHVKDEAVDCDANDSVEAIAHFADRLRNLRNDSERVALMKFVKERSHLAPAFCDTVCKRIIMGDNGKPQRAVWYLLDHMVKDSPQPYVWLFQRRLPDLEDHFPFLESPVSLSYLLHGWRKVFRCPELHDAACQTAEEAKTLTPVDIELKKMQLTLKQWRDAQLWHKEETLKVIADGMLESHRMFGRTLEDGVTSFAHLVCRASQVIFDLQFPAELAVASGSTVETLERGQLEAVEGIGRGHLVGQQEAERSLLQRMAYRWWKKSQEQEQLRQETAQNVHLECASRRVLAAEEQEQWARMTMDFLQWRSQVPATALPPVTPEDRPTSSTVTGVSSCVLGGAMLRALKRKRDGATKRTQQMQVKSEPDSGGKRQCLHRLLSPTPEPSSSPLPLSSDRESTGAKDAAQQMPIHRTRSVQSQLEEVKLQEVGLMLTGGVYNALYGQHFDPKVRKACAWHSFDSRPEWDFSSAVSLGLRENSALISASTVRHHPDHKFLELVTFATDKRHRRKGKGRVMAAVVEEYARHQGCDAILVRAATGIESFWMNPSVGYAPFEPSWDGQTTLAQHCAQHCLLLADTFGLRRCLPSLASNSKDPIHASLERLKWKATLFLNVPGMASRYIESKPLIRTLRCVPSPPNPPPIT